MSESIVGHASLASGTEDAFLGMRRVRPLLSHLTLVMLLVLLLGGDQAAHAARIEVHATPVDSSRSLGALMASAQPGDSLMLTPGMYRGSYMLKPGVSIIGIAGADSTILDAAGERYCLMGRGLDSTTVISGLTLQGGRRPHANSGGGGLYLHRSSPIVINNIFRNHLGYLGPGVYANYFCKPVVAFNVFFGNEGYLGGAIAAYQDCSPLVYNNIFHDNKAISGGAILCMNSTGVVMHNTMAANSVSQGGGGLYFDSSPVLVSDNVISHSVGGGAIFCLDDDRSATLRRNLIWENEKGSLGGACPEYVDRDGNSEADPGFVDLETRKLERRDASDSSGSIASDRSSAGARSWNPAAMPQVPDSVLKLWRDWVGASEED